MGIGLTSYKLLNTICFFLLLTVFSNFSVLAKSKKNSEYSAQNIQKFTKSLIADDNYYRALTELKRLNSYYPTFLKPQQYEITEFYLLFKGKQYQAISKSQNIKISSTQPNLKNIFFLDSLLKEKNFSVLNKVISECPLGSDPLLNNFILKRILFLDMATNRPPSLDQNKISQYQELIKYAKSEQEKLKSTTWATITGLIPGLGYIYSDQTPTGIIALAVVTLSSLITAAAFKTDNKAIGFFTGTIGILFYSGSILGGYLASKKYNNNLKNNLNYHLEKKLNLEQDREYLFQKYGI